MARIPLADEAGLANCRFETASASDFPGESYDLVACFDSSSICAISEICVLQAVLHEALGAFLAVLDRFTLATSFLMHRGRCWRCSRRSNSPSAFHGNASNR